jgi:hypothetical protein
VFVPEKCFLVFLSSVTTLDEVLPFGCFYLSIFLHFHTNEQFFICCTHFNIKYQLDVGVLGLQFDFRYFGCSFGHISKIWAIFFNLQVTLFLSKMMLPSGRLLPMDKLLIVLKKYIEG